MEIKENIDNFAKNHFGLTFVAIILLQVIAMIMLLADSGTPMLVYQAF